MRAGPNVARAPRNFDARTCHSWTTQKHSSPSTTLTWTLHTGTLNHRKEMYPAYIQPPLEFKLVDSDGIPCRAKFWPSKKPCQTYLLFIPGSPTECSNSLGNPGVISYYDEFLTVLHDDSPSTT